MEQSLASFEPGRRLWWSCETNVERRPIERPVGGARGRRCHGVGCVTVNLFLCEVSEMSFWHFCYTKQLAETIMGGPCGPASSRALRTRALSSSGGDGEMADRVDITTAQRGGWGEESRLVRAVGRKAVGSSSQQRGPVMVFCTDKESNLISSNERLT